MGPKRELPARAGKGKKKPEVIPTHGAGPQRLTKAERERARSSSVSTTNEGFHADDDAEGSGGPSDHPSTPTPALNPNPKQLPAIPIKSKSQPDGGRSGTAHSGKREVTEKPGGKGKGREVTQGDDAIPGTPRIGTEKKEEPSRPNQLIKKGSQTPRSEEPSDSSFDSKDRRRQSRQPLLGLPHPRAESPSSSSDEGDKTLRDDVSRPARNLPRIGLPLVHLDDMNLWTRLYVEPERKSRRPRQADASEIMEADKVSLRATLPSQRRSVGYSKALAGIINAPWANEYDRDSTILQSFHSFANENKRQAVDLTIVTEGQFLAFQPFPFRHDSGAQVWCIMEGQGGFGKVVKMARAERTSTGYATPKDSSRFKAVKIGQSESIGEEHHFRQKIASDFETPAAADKCIVNFDTLARCAISGDGRKWTPMLNNRAIVMAVLEPADELVEELIQETKEANGILYKIIGSGRTLFRLFGDMFDRLEQLHSNGWFWGDGKTENFLVVGGRGFYARF